MQPEPSSHDKAPEIERRQIDAWRGMTAAEKLRLAAAMSVAVRKLALAGVRQRYPEASPRAQFLHLAILTLGRDLARQAYPEIDALKLP